MHIPNICFNENFTAVLIDLDNSKHDSHPTKTSGKDSQSGQHQNKGKHGTIEKQAQCLLLTKQTNAILETTLGEANKARIKNNEERNKRKLHVSHHHQSIHAEQRPAHRVRQVVDNQQKRTAQPSKKIKKD